MKIPSVLREWDWLSVITSYRLGAMGVSCTDLGVFIDVVDKRASNLSLGLKQTDLETRDWEEFMGIGEKPERDKSSWTAANDSYLHRDWIRSKREVFGFDTINANSLNNWRTETMPSQGEEEDTLEPVCLVGECEPSVKGFCESTAPATCRAYSCGSEYRRN